MYDRLQAQPVLETAERLHRRILARHASRNLTKVAAELVELIEEVRTTSSQSRRFVRIARPVSRVLIGLVLLIAGVALFLAMRDLFIDRLENTFDWLELAETLVNDVVFVAIAIFFLYSIPERIQRGEVLKRLHKLRSLAHVIDMHQLTKDPERLSSTFTPTSETVPVGLTRGEMESYLDYCSELLSLVSKAAALCAEESRDPVVLDAVSTIETLTNGMSRKIWQKISVLTRA